MSGLTADVEIKDADFLCRCDDGGRLRCDAIWDAAVNALAGGSREMNPQSFASDRETINALLFNLGYEGEISIASDQWSAVTWRRARSKNDALACWIQCDDITDGIAAAYLFMRQHEAEEAAT